MWGEVQALAGLPAFEGLADTFAGPLLEDFKVLFFFVPTWMFERRFALCTLIGSGVGNRHSTH